MYSSDLLKRLASELSGKLEVLLFLLEHYRLCVRVFRFQPFFIWPMFYGFLDSSFALDA